MAKGTRVCKVCGATYEYCHTNRPTGLFRWQDVACCAEHGAQYFAEIAASRGETVQKDMVTNEAENKQAVEIQPAKRTRGKRVTSVKDEVTE